MIGMTLLIVLVMFVLQGWWIARSLASARLRIATPGGILAYGTPLIWYYSS